MKKILSVFIGLSSSFLWAGVEEDFAALLKKVDADVPKVLQNYRPAVGQNGAAPEGADMARRSTVVADAQQKTIKVVVFNPPKQGVERVDTLISLVDGKIVVDQSFKGEPFGDFTLEVSLKDNKLYGDGAKIKYRLNDPASVASRAKSPTHNLLLRANAEAELDLTPDADGKKGSQHNFEFGLLEEPRKGVYYAHELTKLTNGEKDDDTGAPALLNIKSIISLSDAPLGDE